MNIFDYVNNLTTDELRVRLAEYMEKDPMLHAPLVAVEVRLNSNVNANCRYEVLLIDKEGNEHVFSIEPLEMVKKDGNLYTFEAKHSPKQAGQYKSAVRMYPKNKNLPHRQDFCYVKWLELPVGV